MRQSHKTILLWLLLILMFVSIYQLFTGPSKAADEKIAFGAFMQEVQNNPAHIKKVTIKGEHWTRRVQRRSQVPHRRPGDGDRRDARPSSTTRARTASRRSPTRSRRRTRTRCWTLLLGSWLPMLALVFIFFLFMRQLQAGGGKAMSFGKSKAKLLGEHQNKVTFADVAGVEEAKDEVEEIIAFLKDPKKFTKLGGRIPKGVLMMGPPGTGKTLLARAIAGEAGVPFFSHLGLGLRRDVRRRRRLARARPVRAGQEERALHHLHRRDRRGRAPSRRRPRRRSRRARADAQPAARRDGRLRVERRRHPDRRDQPPRRARPGAAAARAASIAASSCRAPTSRGAKASCACTPGACRSSTEVELDIIAKGTPGLLRRRPRVAGQRGGAAGRAQGQGQGRHARLRGGQGQGPDGPRAQVDGHLRAGEAHHRLPRGRPRAGRQAAARAPIRCTR